MSPLARVLLALATAALFASAQGSQGSAAGACAEISMGDITDHNGLIEKIALKPFHVTPPEYSTHKFLIIVPNVYEKDRILVGQSMLVCDDKDLKNKIGLDLLRIDDLTFLIVTCKEGCAAGVDVSVNLFVLRKLK